MTFDDYKLDLNSPVSFCGGSDGSGPGSPGLSEKGKKADTNGDGRLSAGEMIGDMTGWRR